jgi:hypothetical protein
MRKARQSCRSSPAGQYYSSAHMFSSGAFLCSKQTRQEFVSQRRQLGEYQGLTECLPLSPLRSPVQHAGGRSFLVDLLRSRAQGSHSGIRPLSRFRAPGFQCAPDRAHCSRGIHQTIDMNRLI